MVRIYLKFYGCQANLDDGMIVKGILDKKGYKFVNEIKKADICIIGTCVVKERTVNKIIYQLKEIYNNHKKRLIIAGCMPESEKEFCRRIFPKASLINTYHITQITKIVNSHFKNKKLELLGKKKEIKLGLPKINKNQDIVTIQIAQGCISNCSFCETKLAKGFIQSYPKGIIIKEIKRYLKKRIRQFNLSSTDNSAYGFDIKTNLPELLNEIIKIKENFKIRIGMMNPEHVLKYLDDLIKVYKNRKIIKFIHIPLQSGSNKVLKDMNRNYKVKDFLKIVKKFRKEIPEIHISTDIIVGYPSEDNNDFNKTYNLIKNIKPEVLNISKFSSRQGTKASKLKQLSSQEIKKRSVLLHNINRGHSDIFKYKKYSKK